MAKAEALVRSYVAAGFAQDPPRRQHGLRRRPRAAAAGADRAPRARRLCRAAEAAAGGRPVYVIGTEVPVPGGAHEAIEHWR